MSTRTARLISRVLRPLAVRGLVRLTGADVACIVPLERTALTPRSPLACQQFPLRLGLPSMPDHVGLEPSNRGPTPLESGFRYSCGHPTRPALAHGHRRERNGTGIAGARSSGLGIDGYQPATAWMRGTTPRDGLDAGRDPSRRPRPRGATPRDGHDPGREFDPRSSTRRDAAPVVSPLPFDLERAVESGA